MIERLGPTLGAPYINDHLLLLCSRGFGRDEALWNLGDVLGANVLILGPLLARDHFRPFG